MSNNNEKLVLSEVWKNYGEVEAVKGISFTVKDGEFIGILGPSGCGKSSTLRMIAGLEKITDGDIVLEGNRINTIPPRDRSVALAFENYALYPNFTIAGNLAFPLEVQGFPKKAIDEKVEETISYLGLSKYKDMKPNELSGGELQRVALGRALIRGASIYLFDEMLSHLDTRQKNAIRAQLLRLHRVEGSTYILVTHDQSEAVAMSDRVVVMDGGEIQQIGRPDELYDKPANLFVADFIGEPPINLIEGMLISTDGKFKLRSEDVDFPVPGEAKSISSNFENKEVVLGIHPHYISMCEESEPDSITGTVYSYEYLGEMGILTLDCQGIEIALELEHEEYYQPGEELSICFPEEHINLFDPEITNKIV